MKQKRQRGKKTVKPQTIIKAVTHIRLLEANPGKLAALDQLAPVYLALCQQYVTFFCTEAQPDKFHAPLFSTPLSERWHRVAIQQAAGIAQSWRTNRANAYQDYVDDLLDYHEQQTAGIVDAEAEEPTWQEWDVPTLRQTCIQANTNVVVLEPSADSTFDYWLKISTLQLRKPLLVPVKLAAYHKEQITDPKTGRAKELNTSVQLNKCENGVWWLTLSYDETGRSAAARPSYASAWRRRGSKSFPPPAARADNASSAMCARRSTALSTSARRNTRATSSPMNNFRSPR